MAMVRIQRQDENATRLPATKAAFKPQAAAAAKATKPRPALGTICSNLTARNAFLQGVKEKEKPIIAPALVKPVLPTIVEQPIEDIDAFDIEDPQLCCEYVKDIYKYMEKLEVGFDLCSLSVVIKKKVYCFQICIDLTFRQPFK